MDYAKLEDLVSMVQDMKVIPERDIRELCEKAKELLREEPNVVPVRAPVTLVGDVHGQFHDLLELFKIGGPSPNTNNLVRTRAPRLSLAPW